MSNSEAHHRGTDASENHEVNSLRALADGVFYLEKIALFALGYVHLAQYTGSSGDYRI
jgi:hypothetical protein